VFFDTTQGIAQAAIRASGQQKNGAIVTFFAYWIIGVPVTVTSVWVQEKGLKGIWFGPTVAVCLLSLIYVNIFYTMDWEELIEKAAETREKDRGNAEETGADKDDSFKAV